MEQCSICLDALDGGVVALAKCGHRFHAACLARMAGAVGTATTRRGSLTDGEKPVEMRRVGDAEWRWFESQRDAAKAFGVSSVDVSHLVKNPSTASLRGTFEARPAPKKRERPTKGKAGAAPRKKYVRGKCVESAIQKSNGKWTNYAMFPGREFDDLDAYRAAKKQRAARRSAYLDQEHRLMNNKRKRVEYRGKLV